MYTNLSLEHEVLKYVIAKSFRTFNVVDEYNREALAIEVDLNLPSQQVICVLERGLC